MTMQGVPAAQQPRRAASPMRDSAFFAQLEQVSVSWRDRTMLAPVFYYDVTTLGAQCLASVARVRELLPSPRMHPLRVTPRRCVVAIAAFEYRDCDMEPYNEVSVGIPFVLDRPSSAFTGILRQPPAEPWMYIRHLPVNTEFARDAGIEFGGFPKSLADIEFVRSGGWIEAHLSEADRHVLTLAVRQGKTRRVPRARLHAINVREARLLRCETIFSGRDQGESRRPSDCRLELGEHAIADDLRGMDLGRLLSCQHAPAHEAILTSAIESLSA